MPRVAVVMKGYPRLSETFIAQELRALEKSGLKLVIFAMRKPTDPAVHPLHREIEAEVNYLPEYVYHGPLRVLRALLRVRRKPGFATAWRAFLADLRRDPTPDRMRRFCQGAVLADELPADARWLYAHFVHTPSSVTRYAALMTGRAWSFSAHAKDIWTTPDWDLAGKLADATWGVTCTSAGQARLASLAPSADRVHLVYHGVDLARFADRPGEPGMRDGSDAADPVRLLSVGRLVPKKGYDTLLAALSHLPADLAWRLDHIGGGTEQKTLRRRAEALGLGDRIVWHGAQSQPEVLAAYRRSDIFVLPCRVTANGDRDGLPNVLMEAQSQSLACISTFAGAVPELIEDGRTGVLVKPEQPEALAAAITALARAPERRRAMGEAGRLRVRRHFDVTETAPALIEMLWSSVGERRTAEQPAA